MAIDQPARHRTFDVANATDAVTFTLNYTVPNPAPRPEVEDAAEPWPERVQQSQLFTCVSVAPAGVLLDMVAAQDSSGGRSAQALTDFVNGVLIDADLERFAALVHDKDVAIPIEVLGQIVAWLAEEYAGRPTQPPTP